LVMSLAMSALPSAALAQTVDRCASDVRDGVALRRERRDAEALSLFREAAQRCPQPRVRVQLAWAEQAVGRWVDAERDLRDALAGRDDEWVESRRARLDADLARIREHLGQLQITGGVAGARVLVDGVVVATLPMTRSVPALVGAVRVELRLAGYYVVRRDVTIAAGQVAREEMQMQPEPAATPLTPPVVSPSIALPAVAPVVVRPPRAAPPRAPSPWRPVAWTTTLTASALAVGTVAALVVRQVRYDAFQGDDRCFIDAATGLPTGGPDCASAHDDVGAASTAAIVTGVAAGVLAAGAVYAWVRASSSASGERTSAVVCAPAPGGVGCTLRF